MSNSSVGCFSHTLMLPARPASRSLYRRPGAGPGRAGPDRAVRVGSGRAGRVGPGRAREQERVVHSRLVPLEPLKGLSLYIPLSLALSLSRSLARSRSSLSLSLSIQKEKLQQEIELIKIGSILFLKINGTMLCCM